MAMCRASRFSRITIKVPPRFLCRICERPMLDPVVNEFSQVYDRECIRTWILTRLPSERARSVILVDDRKLQLEVKLFLGDREPFRYKLSSKWPEMVKHITWEKDETPARRESDSDSETRNKSLYLKAAELGHPAAQWKLGWCYSVGFGAPLDIAQAVEWYRRSAEQGDADGQSQLGACYERGRGVERDLAVAREWYRRSAEQGNAAGQNALGRLYENGVGVPKNPEEAVMWYRLTAEQGNPSGQRGLARCYENGLGVEEDLEEAEEWYSKSSKAGYESDLFFQGFCYQHGVGGVAQSTATAAKAYGKAASFHLVANGAILPDQYLFWDPDYETSQEYREAADRGDSDAQYHLGLIYEYGWKEVERDLGRALEWYQKSAGRGHVRALNKLAYFHERGRAVAKDLGEAVRLYRQVARRGMMVYPLKAHADSEEDGLNFLRFNLREEEFSNSSSERSREAGNEASNQAGPESESREEETEGPEMTEVNSPVGDKGGMQSLSSEVVESYREGAEAGDSACQFLLGLSYKVGWGVPRDVGSAAEWFRKAAEQEMEDPSTESIGGSQLLHRLLADDLMASRWPHHDNSKKMTPEKGNCTSNWLQCFTGQRNEAEVKSCGVSLSRR